MADRNAKQVRKLKKSHTWIWLIVFTFLVIMSCMLVVFLVAVYSTSFLNGKLDAERGTVENMMEIYEDCVHEGRNPSSVLEPFGREFLIADSTSKQVSYGSLSTCDISADPYAAFHNPRQTPLDIGAYIYDANVYPDTEYPVVEQDGEDIVIHLFDVFSDIDSFTEHSGKEIITDDMIDDDQEISRLFQRESLDKVIKIPLWISLKTSDGQSEFIAKSYISAELQDLAYFAVIVASIWSLVLFGYIAMIINIITGIVRRRRTLRVFFTDPVTQGNNYAYYVYRGAEIIKKRRNDKVRFFVVNLSFIGYRNYCVCHSIVEGEILLAQIYQKLKELTLSKKEICAHAADADFVLLLRGNDENEIRLRIQSIMDTLAHIKEGNVFVFQAGVDTLEPVARHADRMDIDTGEVYNTACAAREAIGNDDAGIAFFDEKLVEDRRWAETVQEHQQAALENEEFVVYYQPKYDPRTDELRGAEALIRWQSPEFGFVPPGRMIPIFEKNGFITEIDHYMLSHVARDQKRWMDAGFKCVPVSVNVSRAHFIEGDLAEQIRDAVDAEGAPHNLIEIELTESAFFDDKRAMINTIQKLKSYGFAVSMDDFGAGYSSLNSLKDMPLDVLKLDAEFFRGESDGSRGEIVVSEAIRLAKSLNMRTVAEGVEQREQVDFLAAQDCDMIQGFFYAKPMPGEDYETRMKEQYKPKKD